MHDVIVCLNVQMEARKSRPDRRRQIASTHGSPPKQALMPACPAASKAAWQTRISTWSCSHRVGLTPRGPQ
jgi:hypothetical protein